MENEGLNNEWKSILGRGMRTHRGNTIKYVQRKVYPSRLETKLKKTTTARLHRSDILFAILARNLMT